MTLSASPVRSERRGTTLLDRSPPPPMRFGLGNRSSTPRATSGGTRQAAAATANTAVRVATGSGRRSASQTQSARAAPPSPLHQRTRSPSGSHLVASANLPPRSPPPLSSRTSSALATTADAVVADPPSKELSENRSRPAAEVNIVAVSTKSTTDPEVAMRIREILEKRRAASGEASHRNGSATGSSSLLNAAATPSPIQKANAQNDASSESMAELAHEYQLDRFIATSSSNHSHNGAPLDASPLVDSHHVALLNSHHVDHEHPSAAATTPSPKKRIDFGTDRRVVHGDSERHRGMSAAHDDIEACDAPFPAYSVLEPNMATAPVSSRLITSVVTPRALAPSPLEAAAASALALPPNSTEYPARLRVTTPRSQYSVMSAAHQRVATIGEHDAEYAGAEGNDTPYASSEIGKHPMDNPLHGAFLAFPALMDHTQFSPQSPPPPTATTSTTATAAAGQSPLPMMQPAQLRAHVFNALITTTPIPTPRTAPQHTARAIDDAWNNPSVGDAATNALLQTVALLDFAIRRPSRSVSVVEHLHAQYEAISNNSNRKAGGMVDEHRPPSTTATAGVGTSPPPIVPKVTVLAERSASPVVSLRRSLPLESHLRYPTFPPDSSPMHHATGSTVAAHRGVDGNAALRVGGPCASTMHLHPQMAVASSHDDTIGTSIRGAAAPPPSPSIAPPRSATPSARSTKRVVEAPPPRAALVQ